MNLAERVENTALGLSVLAWAIAGEACADPAERVSTVRLTMTVLNLCVGTLFLVRSPLLRRASPGALLASIPSVLSSGLAIRLAPALPVWGLAPQVVFAVGGALSVVALAFLGRAFAILPALRGVVARGPYRVVRHPAYAGEIAMVAACALARADVIGGVVLVVSALFVVARIFAEERALGASEAYGKYAHDVRFRLVPGLW